MFKSTGSGRHKNHLLLVCPERGLALLHSRVFTLPHARPQFPLKVFECLGCSLPHRRETGGNVWAFGEGGTSQEWSVLCVDFTVQTQKGSKVHLITCCSLFSFSEKEASSTCGVMNNRFIHVESPTSVCLSLPPFIVLFSHIFSFIIYKLLSIRIWPLSVITSPCFVQSRPIFNQ